jgi:hypothetical protein
MEKIGDPRAIFDHLYAELPAYQREQRDGMPGSQGGD